MKTYLFAYTHYKRYVIDKIHPDNGMPRGAQTRLASAIRCQASYLTQVLKGDAHFSLEQGEAINVFLSTVKTKPNTFCF